MYSIPNDNHIIITIDGPTGSGKSTAARILAEKLKFEYVDSGTIYRILTYLALKKGIRLSEHKKLFELLNNIRVNFAGEDVLLNGKNITGDIRTLEITNKVHSFSKIQKIREAVNVYIRKLIKDKDAVVEGKDAGSVIFPEAKFRFYFDCDIKTRAARRQQDFFDSGIKIPLDKILNELQRRDGLENSNDKTASSVPEYTEIIDTTNMIAEEQVDYLYRYINANNK